jgi:murein DD-endopeptidase MepM/ murein hydrolase activator NlpD
MILLLILLLLQKENTASEGPEGIPSNFITSESAELENYISNSNFNEADKLYLKNIILRYQKFNKAELFDIENEIYLKIYKDSKIHYFNRNSGSYERFDIKVNSHYNILTAEIDGIIWAELKRKNVNFKLIQLIQDLLINYKDYYNFSYRGKITVLYEYEKSKDLENFRINYLSLGVKNKNIWEVFRYPLGEFSQYYDGFGHNISQYFRKAPVEYGLITSHFTDYNDSRLHPVRRQLIPHLGTDYYANAGDPIYASQSGIIDNKGFTKGNGNFIRIKHSNNIYTQYLHMNEFQRDIEIGSYVNKGDKIGTVGKTGTATDVHVCYRFWLNGRQINAVNFKEPNLIKEKKILNEFTEYKNEIYNKLNKLKNNKNEI